MTTLPRRFGGENELSPVLYFGDLLLSPEDWKDLMCQNDDQHLAIDLPFVQLTAKMLQRNIILIPILQKDIQDEKSAEEEQKKQQAELQQ